MHRFNDFKPLVHQRSTVHRDFRSHFPCGMAERTLHGDFAQLVSRHAEKRTSRAGKQNPTDVLTLFSRKTLKNRAVLTVDRNDLTAVFCGIRHDKLAGCDDGFFVG